MCRMFALEYTIKKFKWLKRTSGSQIRVTRYLNNIELSNHIKTLHDNRYTINVIITPAKKFWWYMCISLFVSLSVYPCNRVRSISFFLWRDTGIKFLLHTKITHDLGCVLILTQDHLGNLKVTGKKSALFLSDLYLSYGKTSESSTLHKDC